MTDVTRILEAIGAGNARAIDELFATVYEELRLLAAQKLCAEKPGQTLQATALVHEAYLRLVGDEAPHWSGRAHFFGAAAEAMRRILVENARRRQRLKRGGNLNRVELNDADLAVDYSREDLLALDEAISRLAAIDKTKAELVKLRYFAGLSLEQAADILMLSPTTAKRYWTYARAWLYRALAPEE